MIFLFSSVRWKLLYVMFGIKTKAIQIIERFKNRKLTNDSLIRKLMIYFKADEWGHQANIDTADLGYGWIHYGLIRFLKPKRILCIGSGYGYVPGLLAQACHDNGSGHIDFVDAGYGVNYRRSYTWIGFWKTLEGQLIFTNFGLKKWITLYALTTKVFFQKYPHLRYDYIYIDGDHLYEGVKFDYMHSWAQLRKDGLLVLHDVSIVEEQTEGVYGVNRLWKEITKKNKGIIFEHPVSGLGIIQKI